MTPAPDTLNETLETPVKRKGRAGWFLVLALAACGVMLALYWPKIAAKLNTRQQEASAIEELQSKVEILERRVSELSGTAYQAQQRADEALGKMGESGNAIVAASTPNDAIEARLRALEENTPSPANTEIVSGSTMLALQAKLDQLERQITTGATSVSEETGKALQENAKTRRSLALAASTNRLKNAIDRGEPYETEWKAFATLASNDDALSPLSQTLGISREKGAATPAMLKESFGAALLAWENTRSGIAEDASLVEKIKHNLAQLVVIRKVGETQTGSDEEAILARALAKVTRGAMADAAKELAMLSEEAQSHFKPWREQAASSIATHEAIEKIQMIIWQDNVVLKEPVR